MSAPKEFAIICGRMFYIDVAPLALRNYQDANGWNARPFTRMSIGDIAGQGNERQGNDSSGQRFAAIPLTIIPLTDLAGFNAKLSVSRSADGRPANPAARISVRRRTILLLLWGEGRDEGDR